MDMYMGLTKEQYFYIKQIEAEAIENERRKCTRLGFKLGGTPLLIGTMGFGAAIGMIGLLLMSTLPFWETIGTNGRLDVMGLVLLLIGVWLAVMPFVFFKPKYALIAEIATVMYLVAIAMLSGGMDALFMMGVHALLDAGISF